jgi:hypothetical protein
VKLTIKTQLQGKRTTTEKEEEEREREYLEDSQLLQPLFL